MNKIISLQFLLAALFCHLLIPAQAQDQVSFNGTILNPTGKPVPFANVAVEGTFLGTSADDKGHFKLVLPQRDSVFLLISSLGYSPLRISLPVNSQLKTKTFTLSPHKEVLGEVAVHQSRNGATTQRINPKLAQFSPDPSGGSVEGLLVTLPGVSTNNELSSQYSVRGGNFDENLVYINNVEVYRPFLIRSGQQEGLSIINPDLVESIAFSAGGFEARYGDKMSSVLDITYRRPQEFAASASVSLLGASAHVESASQRGTFTQVHGIRYKTNAYLLGSMDTKGDYQPSFLDYQTYMTLQIHPKWRLGFLGNYSVNNYCFRPETRSTSFGTLYMPRELKIYFEGQEEDRFRTALGALEMEYSPNDKLDLKLITSAFTSKEQEFYDILGQYWLQEVDLGMNHNKKDDSDLNIGVGSFLQHARNKLDATVIDFAHKGHFKAGSHALDWGVSLKLEDIEERITEWEMRDSADYSLPFSPKKVNLYYALRAHNTLNAERVSGYMQDHVTFPSALGNLELTAGLRANYWSFNKEWTWSPRASLILRPAWTKEWIFRMASGVYYQAPFFKEVRTLKGKLNPEIKSQKSIHYVLGADYRFRKWDRPFKFTTELFYKDLSQLIPYEIDNVRIRYHGKNNAHGYAAGVDFKIFGEFVPGVDSWASLSFMKTEEDLTDDSFQSDAGTVHPGYIPRPTDQRYNFSMFFQDYVPGKPNYKMHLKMVMAGGLPVGPPNGERYQAVFRMPSYRRADVSFSRLIMAKGASARYFKSLWMGLEIFNLFDINNTVSYYWVTDIYNNMYAVPNYLTSRRVNVRLTAKF